MSLTEQITKIRKSNERLKEQIRERREQLNDTTLAEYAKAEPDLRLRLSLRRVLKGHIAKVYSLSWSDDNSTIITAAQDGKLLHWDAKSTNKLNIISLKSTWVMSCTFGPVESNLIASAGLDNNCTVYNLQRPDSSINDPVIELVGHTGFVASCKFLSSSQILTGSGDCTVLLWDIETGNRITTFESHNGDVMSVSISPDQRTFISGGCDSTVKHWDIRSATCIRTFEGHESDVNSVQFFPNGLSFVSGSDDATCRLFDLRADRELQRYSNESIVSSVNAVTLSRSGGLLFAGYDRSCIAWDLLKGSQVGSLPFDTKVSCLEVSKDGNALAIGTWDSFVKIWA